MVGEDRGQLCLVLWLQQVLNRARREFGESGVCWGEDRKWSGSLQGFDQACGTESGRQRLKLTSRNRGVDNVLRICGHIISPFANFQRGYGDAPYCRFYCRIASVAWLVSLPDRAIMGFGAIHIFP
jgi:hypothetical protein